MPSQIADSMVMKIVKAVRHYRQMSLLLTITCGVIVAGYLFPINVRAATLVNDGSQNLTVNSLAPNSITPLEQLPEFDKNTLNLAANCPVAINDLAYVKLFYWGFDDKQHVGALIVNKALAQEVLDIFMELYKNKFPIEQMRPISDFKNDDEASMEVNNSSAFSCREVTGQPGKFSQHSYGRAIDINPRQNPYVKGKVVLPKGSDGFIDRDKPEKGKINREGFVYVLFTSRGWDWGGNWHDLKDYQHFEKRDGGEKRDVKGYGGSS
jgi:D-alanyl-D-alanine carboxypeptidase